ncbi:MAG: DUF368 domain-containing protein [Nonlabens sp.]|nr:DUF368 domain-containing protein [Nonlabens sp.]
MQQPTRSASDKFYLVLKGIAMGTANKVPGVSGGVVAFIAGFYEEFIYSFQKLNRKAFALLIRGRFSYFYRYINGKFLSYLFLGEIISYFTVSKIFDVFIKMAPILVWALFFGMILGSVYYISKSFEDWTRRNIMFCTVGTLIGIGTSLLSPAGDNDNLFFVFFCGMVSISGMTLPGLSGSFILILLGNYVLLLVDSINAFFETMVRSFGGDFGWWYDPIHMNLLVVLAVFLLGSLVGLISLSHVLGWTFKHYRSETNATIIGFITGSLGVVWPWKREVYKLDSAGTVVTDINGNAILENYTRFLPDMASSHTWIALVMIVLGFATVYLLDRYGKNEYT